MVVALLALTVPFRVAVVKPTDVAAPVVAVGGDSEVVNVMSAP